MLGCQIFNKAFLKELRAGGPIQALQMIEKEIAQDLPNQKSVMKSGKAKTAETDSLEMEPSEKKQVNKLFEQMALLDDVIKKIDGLNDKSLSELDSFNNEAVNYTQEFKKQLKLDSLNKETQTQLINDLMKIIISHHKQSQNLINSINRTIFQVKTHIFRSKPNLVLYMQKKIHWNISRQKPRVLISKMQAI